MNKIFSNCFDYCEIIRHGTNSKVNTENASVNGKINIVPNHKIYIHMRKYLRFLCYFCFYYLRIHHNLIVKKYI